ncbi:MAG: fibronectin type III domain-containing protein [[Eubacterium] siraeum]
MKIKFKRITALFAALAIMITALPLTIIPISAAGTDGESTEYSSDGYLIVRSYQQLRLAYNGSEESKIRLGADIDCDPEEYKPNYLTRLCPPIESDKTLDLAGYTLKKTGNSIDAQDHLLSVQYSKLTIEDSVGTGKMYFYAKDVAQNLFLAENRSTIVINGGTFCYTGTNAMYCEMIKLSASDLVINDGYFDAQIGTPIKLDNGFAGGGLGTLNSTALINGGTIVTTSSIALSSIDGCDYYASLVMTGGTITNKSKGRVTDKTGTIISDPYFVRVTSDEALQNKYYNITLLGGTMPLSPNDIEVYYPADKAVLTSKAGTITNSAEKVEYTTLLTAPQAGIDEKKAMAARGADEICRLKTDRNNYVLSHTKRTRFTVNSNSVGKIDLLSKAPNPYGSDDPIKTVDWYVSKNFGSFTEIPEAVNDLSYTPPEVTEKCTMLYKAVINYGNVLRINEIIIIDYDFEAVTEIKAVVSGFHGGSKLSDVSVVSGEPEKYSLTINNIRDVYGNNIVNDLQLCKGFKYNIFVKVKLNSGYVAAYTTGTVKMRRFEDPANEWQAADHIYIGLNEIAFKSVLVCDEGIRTVGVEISNFLPYRQVNDLQLTSSEPDKYSVTLVTPLLNTWEYNEEVYDDDELIVDNCYVVEFKVTPKSGYALSPGYIFRCRLDTYREGFWLTSEDKELFTVSNDGTVVINSLRVPFEEYDQNIYVQITPPKAGGTPAKSFISHNLPEHMSLISIDWYDDEEWKTPTVFEKGKTYWCYIYINADCYEYNLKKAKFYLNGTQVRQDYSYNSKYKYYYILGYTEIKIENDVATPTGFAAESATSSSVSLKWDKNANASGYEIEQYKGGKWTQIAKINNSSTVSYNVSGLAADTTYTFRMRAYKTLSSGTSYSDYVRLAAKTQLTNTDKFVGTAISPTAVKLDWNRNDKVTGYIIEQYKGGKWTQIAVTKNNTTLTFTVKGLADATPYSFRIKTYKNADGKTNYSGYTTVKAETPPAAVKNARVTSTTATWITLEWERNANVTGYAIEQYKGGKWTQIAATKNNTTLKFIVKGLNPDTKYSFRIRAYKTNGTKTTYGGYVSMAGTTRIVNVAKFNATALSQTAVKLSWSRNTIASGYVIEQYKGGKWTQINVIRDKNVTTMVVAPLAKGTTYSFRMKSFKTVDGSNRFSEYISAKATTAK